MKYFIKRTSVYDSSPHEKAVLTLVEYWDVRTFLTPEEYDRRFTHIDGAWADRGTEHGICSGGIKRKMEPIEKYTIEIDDLLKFIEEVGDVVISPPERDRHGKDALFVIEIYDGYRE